MYIYTYAYTYIYICNMSSKYIRECIRICACDFGVFLLPFLKMCECVLVTMNFCNTLEHT